MTRTFIRTAVTRLLAAIILVLPGAAIHAEAAMGVGHHQAADTADYASQYREILQNYEARMTAMRSRFLPLNVVLPGASHAQLANLIDGIAVATNEYYEQLGITSPPDDYKAIHKATLSFFRTTIDSHHRLADLIRSGDIAEANSTIHRLEAVESIRLVTISTSLNGASASLSGVVWPLIRERQRRYDPALTTDENGKPLADTDGMRRAYYVQIIKAAQN